MRSSYQKLTEGFHFHSLIIPYILLQFQQLLRDLFHNQIQLLCRGSLCSGRSHQVFSRKPGQQHFRQVFLPELLSRSVGHSRNLQVASQGQVLLQVKTLCHLLHPNLKQYIRQIPILLLKSPSDTLCCLQQIHH